MAFWMTVSLVFVLYLALTHAASSSPHPHQGVLKPFTGKPITFEVTSAEEKKLLEGKGVTKTTQEMGAEKANKKGGRGFALQDVNAQPSVCLDTIADLKSYVQHVPSVKKVTTYDYQRGSGGVIKEKARFDVRVFGVGFTYYIDCKRHPGHNTYTWTLDYSKTSDFDDNVGHWQVMEHPSRPDWSRVLYSTDVKLPSWLPSMVVNFLTKTAIVESTLWVKDVSEAKAKALLTETRSKRQGPRLSWVQGNKGSPSAGAGFGWIRQKPTPTPEPEVVEEPPSLLTRLLPPQRRRCVAILGGSLVGALGARAVWDSVFRTRADPTDKSRSSTGIKQHDR